jgi:hypothetical protein
MEILPKLKIFQRTVYKYFLAQTLLIIQTHYDNNTQQNTQFPEARD